MKVQSRFIEMFGDTHVKSDNSRQWKEVVEIINGKDYKTIQVEDGGYPVYGTGGEMARAADYLSPANSILLGRKGTIDKPLLIKEKYWNVDTAFGAVPDENILNYVYFYWHCKTIDFNILNKGTTLPSTTKVDLLNLWVKIPAMEEQNRFASIVEQADKSKFVGFKSRFIEMFGAEDILHTRWPLFRMDEVFTISSSRRILKSEWKDKGSIPFIRVRDMVQLANKEPLTNEFFVSDEFYNSRPDDEKVKPGDIIVSATSTVGKTYIIKPGDRFYFKDADVLLFRKVKEINEVFFTYGLTMPTVWTQIKEGLGGTTVAHFLISNACKLMQPLPPLELQGQFSDIIQQADKSKYYYQIA